MTVRLISTARPASLALVALVALAGAKPARAQSGDSTAVHRPINLSTTFQELERKMHERQAISRPAVHMIRTEGHYPPGRYIGHCELTPPPRQLGIGDRYEVRRISSRLYRLEDRDEWVEAGAFIPPAEARDYRCSPETGAAQLSRFLTPDSDDDAHYKLVITGYVQEWQVRSCEDDPDAGCHVRLAHRDVHRDIPFTIYPQR